MITSVSGTSKKKPSDRLLACGLQRQPQISSEQYEFDDGQPNTPTIDLRKQHLDCNHRNYRRKPDHGTPGGREPEPDGGDKINHRKEDRRRLIGRRVVSKASRRRGIDAAYNGPVIEPLDHRQARHGAQKHDKAPSPAVEVTADLRLGTHRLNRLKRLLLPDRARVAHVGSSSGGSSSGRSSSGRSSSRATGAKWRSTSASLTAASADGRQFGAWSLSMITALIPS